MPTWTWIDWTVNELAASTGASYNSAESELAAARAGLTKRLMEIKQPGFLKNNPSALGDAILIRALYQFLQFEDHEYGWRQVFGVKPETPLAFRLSQELIQDFTEAEPPEVNDWYQTLQNRVTYFEFPHGSILLADNIELRTIFIVPDLIAEKMHLSVLAIATMVGNNRPIGNTWWPMDLGRKPLSDFDNTMQLGVNGSGYEALNYNYVRAKVENLIVLSSLYYRTVEVPSLVRLPAIPRSFVTKGFKGPRKYSKKRSELSMFSVVILSPPKDRFGKAPGSSRDTNESSWHLEHRVTVRGHFRWQSWGPNHGLRRLQWIDSHERGPLDAPAKHKLHVLTK